MTKKIESFFLDVGFFISENNLKKAVKLLDEPFFGQKPKIVIASALEGLFYSGDTERVIGNDERLLPALHSWGLTEHTREDINPEYFLTDKYYVLLNELQQNCKITFASELVGDVEKIGDNTIFRRDVFRKFRKKPMVGNVVWEKLAVMNKFHSSVICRSKKFPNMLSKLGIPLLKFQSSLKENIARHSRVGLPLYFILHNMGSDGINMAADLGFDEPIEPLTQIAGASINGLALMADG